jgi:hypothetical protein
MWKQIIGMTAYISFVMIMMYFSVDTIMEVPHGSGEF